MPEEITIESLFAYNKQLKARIIILEKEIVELKSRLEKYEHPKNSRNSSIPPSKDENRPKKNNSLRKKSDKKTGGQFGHEGKTLMMTNTPDKISVHIPDMCECCGKSLEKITGELGEYRQQIDLPPIYPIFTEHQSFIKVCSCGHENKGVFPVGVTPGISYGPRIEAIVAYLHTGQYLPYERNAELFNALLNVPISEGSVKNLIA